MNKRVYSIGDAMTTLKSIMVSTGLEAAGLLKKPGRNVRLRKVWSDDPALLDGFVLGSIPGDATLKAAWETGVTEAYGHCEDDGMKPQAHRLQK